MTAHNDAMLARASERATWRRRHVGSSGSPGTCGAPAARWPCEEERDASASAGAGTAAAGIRTDAVFIKTEDDLNGGDYEEGDDDDEEWEEQGLHDVYDATTYDSEDLEPDDDGDDGVDEDGGEDETAPGAGNTERRPPRRMTGEERASLRASHQTHLLCLLARGLLVDAAASTPLLAAMASSVVPRDVAFAVAGLAEDSEGRVGGESTVAACPSVKHVANLAKWFAANVDVVAANRGGGKPSSGKASAWVPRNTERRRLGASRAWRTMPHIDALSSYDISDDDGDTRDGSEVIVLDDTDDDDDDDVVVTDVTEATRPKPSLPAAADPTAERRHARLEALAAAARVASVGLGVRLAFALARRRCTQEEAAAVFVAAARGLGCRARTVAVLEPVPLRATAAALERAGVLEPPVEVSVPGGGGGGGVSGGRGGCKGGGGRGRAKGAPKPLKQAMTSAEAGTGRGGGRGRLAEPVTHWAEVLCADPESEAGARWVCVVPHGATAAQGASERWSFTAGAASVDTPADVASSRRTQRPMPYVVAFRGAPHGKEGGGAKDLTRKYAAVFSRTLPHRTDVGWWSATLAPLAGIERSADDAVDGQADVRMNEQAAAGRAAGTAEDVEMDTKTLTEKVPATLAEVKNHPLWVVERFLTKTQIIHPRHPIKGFIAGECVFPRTCVKELRSAERWKSEMRRKVTDAELATPAARIHSRASQARIKARKDAKAATQRANKNVAGRRKGAKSVEEKAAAVVVEIDEDDEDEPEGDIPLYGEWQTEPWCPPRAVNGIVPKNERGNVDLVAGALPPPGTVHVNLPRVARVARALGLDYAPALVGFEYQRGGKMTPKFEGVVVCEEFETRLTTEYVADEERRAVAAAEKERKEAAKRWRVLLSAIWTRLSLRKEFSVESETNGERGGESGWNAAPRMTAAAAIAAAAEATAAAKASRRTHPGSAPAAVAREVALGLGSRSADWKCSSENDVDNWGGAAGADATGADAVSVGRRRGRGISRVDRTKRARRDQGSAEDIGAGVDGAAGDVSLMAVCQGGAMAKVEEV